MTAKSAKTTSTSGIEISVLVPVMNESGNIASLVDEICAALSGRSFEIIYVDDASNDDSPAELAATAARVPQLRVLRHETRAGQSAAIRSDLLASRGRLIGVLDGESAARGGVHERAAAVKLGEERAERPQVDRRAEGHAVEHLGRAVRECLHVERVVVRGRLLARTLLSWER